MMNAIEISRRILEELDAAITAVDPAQTDALTGAILEADRVFVAGAGRSLMMIRGFAMRLMHLGFTAYVVGETVTPAITDRDLLIIATGSGETGTLKVVAKKAKTIGAKLGVITIYPEASIGSLADYVVRIDAACIKGGRDKEEVHSVQPGGNTFEQSMLIICDAMIVQILNIQKQAHGGNEQIMRLHANLE